MPKIKTNRATAKRFKVTGTGKIKRRQAFLRHININKTHEAEAPARASRRSWTSATRSAIKRLSRT